jgi:anti-sigma factor RsiW
LTLSVTPGDGPAAPAATVRSLKRNLEAGTRRAAAFRLTRAEDAPQAKTALRCPDTVCLVSRYLEGELDAEACARLEVHVKGCRDCGATCATLRSMLVTCRSWWGEKLPEPIRASLRQAIRQVAAAARAGS